MNSISHIRVGYKFHSIKHGEGMVCTRTKRTITAVFENGVKVKITYSTGDAEFNPNQF